MAATTALVASGGPPRATMGEIGRALGAPVGSLYHRFPSRAALLGETWLRLIEDFQPRFLRLLEAPDPAAGALAACRFLVHYVRQHPERARIMLLYRQQEFLGEQWPKVFQRRAEALRAAGEEAIVRFAARSLGGADDETVRRVRFALEDLPAAALRRHIEQGEAPPPAVERLLLETCRTVLLSAPTPKAGGRRANRRKPRRRNFSSKGSARHEP